MFQYSRHTTSSGDARQRQLSPVIAATAVAMGFRNAVVRKLGVPNLTTTVLTLTITGLAADSVLAGGENPRWQRRCAAILAMLGGAAAGAAMLHRSVAHGKLRTPPERERKPTFSTFSLPGPLACLIRVRLPYHLDQMTLETGRSQLVGG